MITDPPADGYHQQPFALPADATEILLVRHGASAPAIPGVAFPVLDGHANPPLAPAGERQAAAVAERLGGETLAGLFVSGLRRTVQTAAPLAARLGVEPVEIPSLREVRLGDWEGGEFRIRMARHDPLAMQMVQEERWDVIPGAEAPESLAARVRAGVGEIVERVGGGVAAVAVVHGGVIGELCRQATASRPFAFVHADNASLTRLVVFAHGRWLLRSFNDISHLS